MRVYKHSGEIIFDGKDMLNMKEGMDSLDPTVRIKHKGAYYNFSGFQLIGDLIFDTPILLSIDNIKAKIYIFYIYDGDEAKKFFYGRLIRKVTAYFNYEIVDVMDELEKIT